MTNFKRKRRQTTKNKPSALLLSDWHLRETTPQCRLDDFWKAQEAKVDFILELAKKFNIPVLVAGDLGHLSKWSCKLLEWFISKIDKYKVRIFVILGQHDLPGHQISRWNQSGCGVLHAAEAIKVIFEPTIINDEFIISPFHYGQEIINSEKDDSNLPMIVMVHTMVVENKDLFPGQNATKGHQLLKRHSCFSLLHSGDNHLPFVAEYEGRILCNPGSIMRSTAAQINHQPRVYLWYAQENKIEIVYLPIKKNVISREHIDITEERSERMDAYLEKLKNDVEIQLSFEQNIENYFAKYRTQLPIKEKVFAAMEI